MAKKFDGEIIRQVAVISDLGALADQAALKFGDLTIEEDFRILRTEQTCCIVGLDDLIPGANGLLMGICNGELSVAEIAAALGINGPVNRNDRDKHEKAGRWVKVLSALVLQNPTSTSTRTVVDGIFLNETGGPIIVSKDRWTYSDPEGWSYFIFNNSGTALQAGAKVRSQETHYGVWVT